MMEKWTVWGICHNILWGIDRFVANQTLFRIHRDIFKRGIFLLPRFQPHAAYILRPHTGVGHADRRLAQGASLSLE